MCRVFICILAFLRLSVLRGDHVSARNILFSWFCFHREPPYLSADKISFEEISQKSFHLNGRWVFHFNTIARLTDSTLWEDAPLDYISQTKSIEEAVIFLSKLSTLPRYIFFAEEAAFHLIDVVRHSDDTSHEHFLL